MKNCPNCNASVIDTAKFCHKCRFNIKKYEDEQASAVLYCTECGAELQPDASFCTECGADVVNGNEPALSLDEDTLNLDGIANLSSLANEQMYQQNGFTVENGVLTGYTGKKRNITIFGSIEEIFDGVFENNQIITCVEIEEGVKSIGRKAFASCSSLIEISIPASCKIIYTDTFKNTSLNTLILGSTFYKESVIKACLSDKAQSRADLVSIKDFVTECDGKSRVNIVGIENAILGKIKEEEDKIAEEKRKEQERIEAERRRKEEEERNSIYSQYNAGTTHTFGAQNHGASTQGIVWKGLERNGNKALLISKYIIDRQKFNESAEATNWEHSSIRKWLNNYFYKIAFTETEKSKILTTALKNTPNQQHGTSSGNDTNDKIFLLSADEVQKYYKTFNETRCQVTLFAKNNGAYCDGAYFGYWWLRTAGQLPQNASYIFYTGGISQMGYDVTGTIFGVRPAMWISLEQKSTLQLNLRRAAS